MEINLTEEKINELKKDGFLEINYNNDFYVYIELDNAADFYCEVKNHSSKHCFDNHDLEKLEDKKVLRWGSGEPRCPSCSTPMIFNYDYCPKCGQKLLWNKEGK